MGRQIIGPAKVKMGLYHLCWFQLVPQLGLQLLQRGAILQHLLGTEDWDRKQKAVTLVSFDLPWSERTFGVDVSHGNPL
jgi:hypothetical protein